MIYTPRAAFASISIISSSDTFYGPGLVQVVITDTTSPGATINADVAVVNPDSTGSSQSVTVFQAGSTSQYELYLTTSDAPFNPASPLAGLGPDAVVVRIHNPPFVTDNHDDQIGIDLQDGAVITISYGGQTQDITFTPTVASLSLDRTTAGDGNNIYVTADDNDANIDPTGPDAFDAAPFLSSSINGMTFDSSAQFVETGANTGQFEFLVKVSNSDLPPNGAALTPAAYPSSEDFVFQDKNVYQVVSGAVAPFDAISPLTSTNTPSASVDLQNQNGIITLAGVTVSGDVTIANDIKMSIVDADRNIDTKVTDVIPAGAFEITLAGVSGVVNGVPLIETGDNTGVFVPDIGNNIIPIYLNGFDVVTSTGIIRLRPSTIATDPDISIKYLDTNVDPSGFGNITYTTNIAHDPGIITNTTPNLYPSDTFRLTINDGDLNSDSQAAESYSLSLVGDSLVPRAINFTAGVPNYIVGYLSYYLNNGTAVNLPSPIPVTFTETGANTGIFTSNSINIGTISSAVSGGLTGNDVVTFLYHDVMETPSAVSSTPLTILPVVTFDRNIYIQNDTARVIARDPVKNTNSGTIQSVSATITSDSDPVGQTVTLFETGLNTGVFMNTVDLSSSSSPSAVVVNVGDTIYTSYPNASSARAGVVRPGIHFNNALYNIGDSAGLVVIYPPANINIVAPDSITVDVTSTSDPVGTTVSLSEPFSNTGIFNGSVTFTSGASSGPALHVAPGDTVTATYLSLTNTSSIVGTPSGQSFSVTTDKTTYTTGETVVVSGDVGDTIINATDVVNVSCCSLEDILGNPVAFQPGVQSIITFDVHNLQSTAQPFVAIVQVRGSDGHTELITWQAGTLSASASTQIGLSWTPEADDNYTFRILVLSDLSSLQPLYRGATYDVRNDILTYDNAQSQVILEVFNPSSFIYRLEQVEVLADGSFSDSFLLSGSLAQVGNYSLVAAYGNNSTGTTFNMSSLLATISVELSDTTAAWGEDVLASVTVTGAQAGDYVVVDQGNGVTFTYPAFTGSFDGSLDPATLVYGTSDVAQGFGVTATLYDNSSNTIATSSAPSVFIGPRPTILTLHLPVSVVNGTILTASGELADGLSGVGLPGRTIIFNTLAGIPLSVATTGGIDVQDAGGIEIVSCDVPRCTADNPNANSVNLLKLHSGSTMSLPSGVTTAAFTLQDIGGGTATVRVTRSDASTFDATSDPAGLGLATFVLSARDSTHPNQYLQSIEVISATGGLFGTSNIVLSDADADPTTLVSASFDYLAAQSYGTMLAIASGSYYSSAIAPVLILPDIPVSAHFIGDSLYLPADADQAFATELGIELDNIGIGGTVAIYANANPNFTTISCSAADPDSDGDGLCNSWETGSGIPYACATGTCNYVLPSTMVPVTNAPQTTSSLHKDIFIEIDAMDGQAPLDGALKRAIDAFAAAPVSNPDGTTGITLHIIKDEMNLSFVGKMDSRVPTGSPQRLFNAWVDPVTGGDNGDKTDDYFGIKSLHYGTTDQQRSDSSLKNARANAVRYSLWVSTIGDSTTSGLAEDLGNDLIISLGSFGGDLNQYGSKTGTEIEQAGAFMHELGHVLNLKHGGPAEIVATMSGTQSDAATMSSGGALGNYPRTTTLDGYTVSTMGPGSTKIKLQQVVNLSGSSTSVNALTVTPSSTDSLLGTPTISLDGASTSTKKIFNINYQLSVPYMDPTQGIDYAVDLGTPNTSKYLQAANSGVYDVSTQDFWIAGMFKRTYDSGSTDVLIEKKSGTTSINSGYSVYVSGADQLVARIANGASSIIAFPSTTVQLNKWYSWAVYFDRDGRMTIYLYDIAAGTLSTASADITSQSASITNALTFTVGRRTNSASFFFSGQMDNLIPPQIGQTLPTLTASDFSSFVRTGTLAGTAVKYNFNSWDASAAVVDATGGNQLTAYPSNQPPAFVPDTTVPMVDSSVTQIIIPRLTINFKVSSNVNIAGFGTPTYPTLSRIIPPDISTNCKPNYESVMSYARQMPRYLNEIGEYALDYSRGNYAPLDENNLFESQGVFSRDGLNSPHNTVIWGSPSGLISTMPGTTQVQKDYSYGPGQSLHPIDWSADGSIGTVQANILNLSIDGCNPAELISTTLHDYNDWNNIKLNWKQNSLGTFDGVTRAATKAAVELTEETDEQMKAQVIEVQIDTLTSDKIYYGESVSITGSSTNAPENAMLLIDWGDGMSEQFEGAVDPVTGAWPVEGIVLSHTYESGGVGERRITASLLDSSHEVSATSSGTTLLVQDVIAPLVSLPADFVVEATGPDGAPVTYEAVAEDEVDGSITPVCIPASGSTFAIGTTTVTCTATDTHGNIGSATFNVTVLTQSGAIKSLADLLDSMNLDKGTTNSLKSKLNAALQSLANGDKTTAKNQLSAFINEVNAQTGKKITTAQASQLISVAQNTIRAIG